jgi:hypothetical protein
MTTATLRCPSPEGVSSLQFFLATYYAERLAGAPEPATVRDELRPRPATDPAPSDHGRPEAGLDRTLQPVTSGN